MQKFAECVLEIPEISISYRLRLSTVVLIDLLVGTALLE